MKADVVVVKVEPGEVVEAGQVLNLLLSMCLLLVQFLFVYLLVVCLFFGHRGWTGLYILCIYILYSILASFF